MFTTARRETYIMRYDISASGQYNNKSTIISCFYRNAKYGNKSVIYAILMPLHLLQSAPQDRLSEGWPRGISTFSLFSNNKFPRIIELKLSTRYESWGTYNPESPAQITIVDNIQFTDFSGVLGLD